MPTSLDLKALAAEVGGIAHMHFLTDKASGEGMAVVVQVAAFEALERAVEIAQQRQLEADREYFRLHILPDAVAAEREACARVADDYNGRGLEHDMYTQLGDASTTLQEIAAAIRARSGKEQP